MINLTFFAVAKLQCTETELLRSRRSTCFKLWEIAHLLVHWKEFGTGQPKVSSVFANDDFTSQFGTSQMSRSSQRSTVFWHETSNRSEKSPICLHPSSECDVAVIRLWFALIWVCKWKQRFLSDVAVTWLIRLVILIPGLTHMVLQSLELETSGSAISDDRQHPRTESFLVAVIRLSCGCNSVVIRWCGCDSEGASASGGIRVWCGFLWFECDSARLRFWNKRIGDSHKWTGDVSEIDASCSAVSQSLGESRSEIFRSIAIAANTELTFVGRFQTPWNLVSVYIA